MSRASWCPICEDYDWQGDKPLEIPFHDLVIYEMHVRSFTQHPSSGVRHRGTYAGLTEKIAYLKALGVNCVELMLIFEFDEFENAHEVNGRRLLNYWGYSTVGFLAPKAGYRWAVDLGLLHIFGMFEEQDNKNERIFSSIFTSQHNYATIVSCQEVL